MRKRLTRALSAAVLACAPALATAQVPEALWLRDAAIAPDGSRIAFAHGGQIWTVPATGGQATALTAGLWRATHPVWSPDGRSIAFAADRHGQDDVFAMPAEGGAVTRLTHQSGPDRPMAFTPDGMAVVFTSQRLGDPTADAMDAINGLAGLYERPWTVPVTGGRPQPLLPTLALNIDFGPEGRILYEDNRSVIENRWRKHQVSDAARDIWLHDPATGSHRQLTEFRGEDRDPSFGPDGRDLIWLSEQGGSFNVWRRAIDGGEAEQLTFHERWPVRFISAADDGTLAYAWDGGLWRLDPGAEAPERLRVTLPQGSLIDTVSTRDVTGEVSQMAVSPGGAEIAFVARGEVFVTGWESQVTRRVTDTVDKEADPAFSADGLRLAYASEREGDWDIYESAVPEGARFSDPVALTERRLIDDAADLFGPKYDPAGTRLAYIRDRAEIRVQDLSAGTSTVVQPGDRSYSYKDGDLAVDWSPSGDWLLTRLGFSTPDVALIAADGSESHNISRNGFSDLKARFSADGSAILWLSDRYGLRATDGGAEEVDVMAAHLTRAAAERFGMTRPERARAGDAPTPGTPEFDGIERRTARLSPRSAQYAAFGLMADGRNLFTALVTPDLKLEASVRDLTAGSERALFSLPAQTVLALGTNPELTAVFVMTPGRITRYDLATGQSAAVPVHAEVARDIRDEVAAIIRSNWHATAETFYRADMQGVDWQGVRDHYLRFAPHIQHWEDLADLLGEMVGELNASHQLPSYHHADPLADASGSLGLYYDHGHTGPGMRIAEVLDGGPADRAGSLLRPGATILAVDGREIAAGASLHAALNRSAGRELRLSVAPPGGGAPADQIATPISLGAEGELVYQRWVEKRRAMVAALSDGRLGYIHIRGMTADPYRTAYGELFGRYAETEGVVVDIRANGGGNLHDQLIVMLTGSTDAVNRARDGHVVTRIPIGRWTKPSVLIQNAGSYSDASVFPMLYRAKGVGRIVGDRTPGTGTAVSAVPQLEAGLSYRVPELGFQLIDETWFENTEVVPDLLVRNDPESLAAGHDAQLEAAVADLLRQIDEPPAR
ncbi:S41 family peptidase [Frigidibacter sp. MR17.24]|uniref:S41 family peptidase n=1 Tax=Frigidibacter sp. MR17.24 TaxID=3127345 RepID=UPI003012A76C